jgi:hypothetical protein
LIWKRGDKKPDWPGLARSKTKKPGAMAGLFVINAVAD